MQAEQRLAGGDQVAVLDEPLDDLAAVGRGDGGAVAQAGDLADGGAGGEDVERLRPRRTMWKVPLIGETTIRQVGVVSMPDASPCLAQNSRAASSWSGVLSAKVSTPLSARLAMPVRVPAGGISRMPVTPRSSMVSRHRSQRTGLAIWPTIRASTSRPSWTTLPSRLEITRVRGSCVDTERARPARWPTAGSMWWVWKAPATLSGISRALAGGSSANALELLQGAGGDDLAGTVVVGRGQAVLVDGGEHLVAVAAEDGGHPGRGDRGGLGHRVAALADQHHRLLGGDHAGAGGGGDLADAVAGDRADLLEGVGGCGKTLEGRDQAGRDQQRLGDLGVADRVGVRLGAVVGQVEAGDRREPVEARGERRVLEPGREEAGRLGTLAGSDDHEHVTQLCRDRGPDLASGPHENRPADSL